MSSFKYKPEKLKYLSNISTLDEVHRKQVADFSTKRMQIPNKKEMLRKLNSELREIERSGSFSIEEIKKRAQIKEQIEQITEDLYELENGICELDYYSRTSDILIEYYNIMDDSNDSHFQITNDNNLNEAKEENVNEKANISQKLVELNLLSQQKRKIKKPTRKRAKRVEQKQKQNILSFFSGSGEPAPTQLSIKSETCSETCSDSSNVSKLQCDKPVNYEQYSDIEKVVSNKATLFDEYMMLIDRAYVSNKSKTNPIRLCLNCGVEKTLIQSEGSYVCQKCGETEHIIVESEVPNHKDATSEKPKYPYKRLNIWVLIAINASQYNL